MSNGFSWWVMVIYGHAKIKDRNKFLEEISSLNNTCSLNWILGGDFNVIRWENEISATNLAKYNMKKFNSVMNSLGFIEHPLTNGKFTWSNLRAHAVLSRLDRFLYTPQWEDRFTIHFNRTLAKITSNHYPLILENSQLCWGPSPFRFNNVNL